MPGIDAIAEGGGTSETVAFATTAPSLLVTLPFTDDVCADAAFAAKRTTALATATRNLCMFFPFFSPGGWPLGRQPGSTRAISSARAGLRHRRVDISMPRIVV